MNPTDPVAEAITLVDIAWALSRIPRFMGHTITEVPYNVAQHSIYVVELIRRALDHGYEFAEVVGWKSNILEKLGNEVGTYGSAQLLLQALFHDAHEAYLGDVPSPIKRIPELKETYRLLELQLDHAIRSSFGLAEPTPNAKAVIHFFDKLAQSIEGYHFMRSRGSNWNLPKPTLSLLQKFPKPLPAIDSYTAFLETYQYLTSEYAPTE